MLFFVGESGEEGECFVAVGEGAFDGLGGFADVALAREGGEDVAGGGECGEFFDGG